MDGAPRDIFDGDPALPLVAGAPDDEPAASSGEIGAFRLLASAGGALLLGWLFRFPPALLFALPFAGLAVGVVGRRRALRGPTIALLGAAFMAQATSIFVTPFTWPLRFVFFLSLIGGLGLMIRWQMKGL